MAVDRKRELTESIPRVIAKEPKSMATYNHSEQESVKKRIAARCY